MAGPPGDNVCEAITYCDADSSVAVIEPTVIAATQEGALEGGTYPEEMANDEGGIVE